MKQDILFELRGARSRAYVAEKLDISPQMLGMIERGARRPSLNLAWKMAAFYGRSVDELFFACQKETG